MTNLTHNNKKSQVISLHKARTLNRNKHISSLIDSIQDNGPATFAPKKAAPIVNTKMNKAPLVMITRTPGKSQEETPPSPPPVAPALSNSNRISIPIILIATLLLSASICTIYSLNTRINSLELQINIFHEQLDDFKQQKPISNI